MYIVNVSLKKGGSRNVVPLKAVILMKDRRIIARKLFLSGDQYRLMTVEVLYFVLLHERHYK